MKIEKSPQIKDLKNPKDIETQKFDKLDEFMVWEKDKDENRRRLKKMIISGVAIPDFDKDDAGNIKSLTVKRLVDNSIIFYADDKTHEGREDIKKIME